MLYINNSTCFILEVHEEIRENVYKASLEGKELFFFYVEKHYLKMVFKPLKYNSTEYIVLQVLC